MNDKQISQVMSHLAKLSNRVLTDAQREARRNNAEKARAARKAKRDSAHSHHALDQSKMNAITCSQPNAANSTTDNSK